MSLVNEDRPLTHEQQAFKLAFSRAIDLVGGGKRMADALSVSDGQVSRWKHPQYHEHVPASLFQKVDAAAGYPCMLETAAVLAGYSIRRDEVLAGGVSLMEATAALSVDSGRLVGAAIQAKADDQICLRELNLLEAEGKTVIANVTQMIEAARAKYEAGQGGSVVKLAGAAR